MTVRSFAAWAMALAGCLLLFSAQAQTQSHPPVEAFGNLPRISAPKLSPDGKHFAVVQSLNGRPVAVIYQTFSTPGVKPVIFNGGDAVVADIRWAKNDRLIVITKFTKAGLAGGEATILVRGFAIDVDGRNLVTLMKNRNSWGENTNTADIVDLDLDDPNYIFMDMYGPHYSNGPFVLDVYKVDIHSGSAEVFDTGQFARSEWQFGTNGWLMDGHGHVVARLDQSAKPLKDQLSIRDGSEWKAIGTFDATGDKGAGLIGLTQDGKALVQEALNGQSFDGLLRHDLSSGADTPLFFDPHYDISEPIIDEWTGHVVGASYIDDHLEFHYFDPERQALQKGLEQAFPGLTVHAVSSDIARNNVIVAVEGPRNPTVYYLLDRTTHQMQALTDTYPSIQETDLGDMKPYNYTARDGLAIPAYLTLPPGKAPKSLPVVIMPHGGPDYRDYVKFDWMAQFLANRGYAVLQPNFRGSSGYGHKFTEAGLQQWGTKIEDDVTDGVRKLIADGIADPKRICIFGGSFGGYVALAGAAFNPDQYACAASWAGVSDLLESLHSEYSDYGENSGAVSFWGSRIGSADTDIEKLKAQSPDRHADKIKCPVLLMHGAGDTTVYIAQSELMRDALEGAHKKVEYIRFEGEDHYMTVADTRIRMLKTLEKFLAENIGN